MPKPSAARASGNPDEWTRYGLTPGETRYSPLNQIDTSNVSRLGLELVLSMSAAAAETRKPRLCSANNTLYSITNWSIVFAVDARTGKEKWRWDPEVNQDKTRPQICCGVVNRGLAMYQNLIIAPDHRRPPDRSQRGNRKARLGSPRVLFE